MDIVSHALAGAATGLYFQHPVAGALVAISPDLVLGVKRRIRPNHLYMISHSGIGLVMVYLLTYSMDIKWLFYCYLSHIVLDFFTHAGEWCPQPLFPFVKTNSYFKEWEFFNKAWFMGLFVTILWSLLWL